VGEPGKRGRNRSRVADWQARSDAGFRAGSRGLLRGQGRSLPRDRPGGIWSVRPLSLAPVLGNRGAGPQWADGNPQAMGLFAFRGNLGLRLRGRACVRQCECDRVRT